MTFVFSIPNTPEAEHEHEIRIEAGSSALFVGANGGGKTRLAVYIESRLGRSAHRISAHRALALNPSVTKISEANALAGLRSGKSTAVHLVNDFDFLIQALFAEQSNKALATHRAARAGNTATPDPTQIERLATIWHNLLPDRQLVISGDDINVAVPGTEHRYPATELSDGERAVFYMIGQSLVAEKDSVLIIDEPELHIHRSIMSKLWDQLEAERQDCAFVFITHDLDFAASRLGQKFVIREYHPAPRWWTIEEVPDDTGFDEQISTLILGSRHPILFVEGSKNSLDQAIYRCCFPEWTVIPKGSCEEVIHSVVTMRHNETLTRVTCSGIIDADGRTDEDIKYLNERGVAVLPVSEIENIVLLPSVSRAIARTHGYEGEELDGKLEALANAIFEYVTSRGAIDDTIARHCRRRIDSALKKSNPNNLKGVNEVIEYYEKSAKALNIRDIVEEFEKRIQGAMRGRDLPALLAHYDNKGLLALAAQHLKGMRRSEFEAWFARVLRNDKEPELVSEIQKCLPKIRPQ